MNPEPIHIDRDSIYTLESLDAILRPMGMTAKTFVGVLRPKKVFRMGWLGKHLLEAFDNGPELIERTKPEIPEAKNRGNRKRLSGKLIGGVFTEEELGIG